MKLGVVRYVTTVMQIKLLVVVVVVVVQSRSFLV